MQENVNNKSIVAVIFSVILVTTLYFMAPKTNTLTPFQMISSVSSGIIMGVGFFYLQWGTYSNFITTTPINIPIRPYKPKPVFIRRTGGEWEIIFAGLVFYILGYFGDGVLFGYDFGTEQFTGQLSDFTVSPLITILLLGMMFGMYLPLTSGFIEIIVRLEIPYAVAAFVSIICIVSAIIFSAVFFNNNPFLFVAIASRIVWGLAILLIKPSERTWKMIVIIVVVLVVTVLPTIAFVFGNRIN